MAKTAKTTTRKIVKKKKAVKKPVNIRMPVYGYLIIERDKNDMYAYYEAPKHHAVTEPMRARTMLRIQPSELEKDCDLSSYGVRVYFVQELYKDDPVFHYA